MPKEPERFRRSGRTLRTQLLMVGAAIGAIGALSLSWAFSWGMSSVDAEVAARLAAKEAAFHSPPGSCLNWTQPDASDAHKVPCEQPHLFEVIGVVDISDQYPPGAPSPDLQLWRQIAQERCGESAQTYLNKPLDPYGKLTLGVLRPPEQQWADGARELRCGLQWAGPGGSLQPLTGPAVEQDQSNVWPVGTCLGLNGKTVGDPVDCARPHSYEIVAVLDLTDEFTEGYPAQEDQKAWLDLECNKALEEYSGGANLDEQGLLLGWDLREQESWDAGSTKVNCKVGATLEDGSGLAPVRGSINPAEKSAAQSTAPAESSAPAGAETGG
ncbi:septum formation family protein [Amycolatopsis aidingensis]|uniref:septum formation family protein n=1 Tax=Amycolatopsis aidingensis TaxID=2842453 RepID=UPI001C0DDCEE|nr:septum formation family protein [Amycolatopsis aidingensis]